MSFIGVTYLDRRLYILKPATWQQMLAKVSQSFFLDDGHIEQLRVLYRPDICDDSSPLWELDHEAWEGVRDGSSIHLEIAENRPKRDRGVDSIKSEQVEELDCVSAPSVYDRVVNVEIRTVAGKKTQLRINPSVSVLELKQAYQIAEGIAPDQFEFMCTGRTLKDDRRLDSYGIGECSHMYALFNLRGGKPAIYLLSPQTLSNVEVEVTLCPEWTFNVLYPLTLPFTAAFSGRNAASWTVDVHPDGTMRHNKTGLDCSYLFWEAASHPQHRDYAPKTASDSFNPAAPQPFLQHQNEVLPFERFLTRLDAILKDLCLTAAMRTEFIVYWLPAFQRIRDRDQLIKFTFVPQEAFEKAAAIYISSVEPPKTISRVFMLFSGVGPGSDDSHTLIDWVSHVGQDQEAMKDAEAFRVLEWGGMEVRD